MTDTADKRPHPDLIYDPVAEAWLHRPTGRYCHAPPTRRYRYIAVEPFRIEQVIFKAGTLLGTGNVAPGWDGPAFLLTFEPADDLGVAVGAGHVVARLQAGAIRAEAIEE